MKKIFIVFLLILMSTSVLLADVSAAGYEEAGYYDDDPDASPVVNDFLKYFTDEMFELTLTSDWTTANNDTPYGVDIFDLVYYCGHGGWWGISMYGSEGIDFRTAGNNSDGGYGYDLEFIILHSCSVVPGPLEVGDWWTPWINEPGGIFDNLHMVCGFRTGASKVYDNNIADYMGYHTFHQTSSVFSDWINATIIHGSTGADEDKCCLIFLYDPNNTAKCANTDIYGGSVCSDHDPSSTYLVGMWYDT